MKKTRKPTAREIFDASFAQPFVPNAKTIADVVAYRKEHGMPKACNKCGTPLAPCIRKNTPESYCPSCRFCYECD